MAKPKVIQINHTAPKEGKPFALLPFGMYCNVQLQKAEMDSVMEFSDGWKREKRVLVRRCKLNVNSSVFTFLLKSVYGEQMRWDDLRRRWEAWAIVEGLGKDGFSDKECLLIEVAPYDEEAYKAEQERKRKEAEAKCKAAERERLLKQAKKGIYEHKDLI